MPVLVRLGIAKKLVPWAAHGLDDPLHRLVRLKVITVDPHRFADGKNPRAGLQVRTPAFSEPDAVMQ